jgi:hypothetical protein
MHGPAPHENRPSCGTFEHQATSNLNAELTHSEEFCQYVQLLSDHQHIRSAHLERSIFVRATPGKCESQLTFSSQTMAPSAKQSGKKPAGKTGRSAIADVVAREYTIHLHKRVC